MNFDKAKKLRTVMAEKPIVVGVGARDALDAKLIERAGFDFIWSSGFDISASYAVADANLLSMKQYLEEARAMNEVVDIPVVADCDTGYGNVANLIYSVKLFEEAGMAAICIEDKIFPKTTSLLPGGRQELSPAAEFAGKIQAAKDTQRSDDLIVIARVEALIAGLGLQEALERAGCYAEAGADLILIHSKARTPEEIVEFVRNWQGAAPLVLVPTTYPQLTERDIRKLGKVKAVIYANQLLRAGIKAEESLLKKIRERGSADGLEDVMVPVSHVFELQGVARVEENEKRYSS